MSNLEKAKEIVKANYRNADCGIFDNRKQRDEQAGNPDGEGDE